MKKVLYASYGYTTHDRRFLNFFLDHNWDVQFVRFDGNSHEIDSRPLPIDVTIMDWLGTKEELTDSNFHNFIMAFQSLVNGEDIDLVVAGPIHTIGYICSSVVKVPLVLISWAFDLLIEIESSNLFRQQSKFAISKADGLIVDCQTVQQIAVSLGAFSKPIMIIPWGVELEKFQMNRIHATDQVFRILSIRSFEKIYDLPTLIYAISHLSNKFDLKDRISFTLAGDGSQNSFLRKLARDLGVDKFITWLGRVSEDELPELFDIHDLYISTSRSDGSSISMLQALATGLPVLVSNIESNREWIVEDLNGWTFIAGDSVDLAKKIHTLFSYLDFRKIQENGRAVIEQRANWKKNQITLNSYLRALL